MKTAFNHRGPQLFGTTIWETPRERDSISASKRVGKHRSTELTNSMDLLGFCALSSIN